MNESLFFSLLEDYKNRPNDLNINCTDPLGRTSLVIAIENESFELIEVLLEGGINVSVRSRLAMVFGVTTITGADLFIFSGSFL